jgi:SAM-dependent methyltransferase
VTAEADAHRESLRRMARAPRYNQWLLERARPYLRGRVLDAGAGTGTFSKLVAADVDSVVALEPEAELVPLLRENVAGHSNVIVVEGTAEDVAAAGLGPFDAIVCLNVLEHIEDHAAVLRAFASVLAPGGHLLLLVPAHPLLYGAIDETVGHVRRYRRRDLQRGLGDAGLAVADLRYVNPLGALGWLVSSRLLRRAHVPEGPLIAYDRLVPLLTRLDRLPTPFGLSLWAVGRRDG